MRKIYTLEIFAGSEDIGNLALRLLTGSFLIYGVLDNILDPARMAEFVEFMRAFGFFKPELLAPVSVYAQLLCGIALILGLLVRWAGLILVINFIVAVIMVHWQEDFRGWWPAIILVGLGFYWTTAGAGRYSIDRMLGHK